MLCRSPYRESARPVARDFPVALDIHYRGSSGRPGAVEGSGRTLWMSSEAMIFQSDGPIPAGTELEISVCWPARLNDCVRLQLWIRAYVLYNLDHGVKAEIRKYEFRTRSLAAAASETSCPAAVADARGA